MKEKQKENLKTAVQVLSIMATIVLAIIMCIGISKIKTDTNLQAEIARTKTYEQVKDGDEKIQIENSEGEIVDFDYVQFNAFFLKDLNGDGYAEKVRGTCKEVGTEDTLYMSVNVLTNGTLKNGKIEIIGDNIYFQTALVDDDCIKGNYISDNTKEIELKEIGTGTQKLIFGNVRTGVYTNANRKTEVIGNDTTKYTGINKVKFTGIHVSTDGKETPIEKEIELTVDWYAKPKAEIPYTYAGDKKNRYQSYNSDNMINSEKGTIDLSFKIVEQETNNLQQLSKAYVEGEIPELNGYAPIDVEITGTNVTYTYDKETRKYTAQREAVVDATGKVISEAYSGSYKTERYNEFDVKVSYPIEAYETLGIDTVNLDIPIRGYYEGYNNPQEEFENPIRSNLVEDIISVVYSYGGGDVIAFDVKVGKYVEKPYDAWVVSKEKPERIYKNVENTNYEEDTYEVMWAVARGADGKISNVKLKETDENYTDKFLTTDNQYKSMEEITTNKGIYFKSAGNMFGKDGYINVINDETGELIHQFTANDWNTYTKENPYLYETGIKHIRIETSEASKNSVFYVYNIKEIDNEKLTQSFTQEEFEKLRLIYSYMTGYIKYNETDEYIAIKNDLERANYDSIKSIVSINKVDPVYYSTQETKENAKITIRTQILEYNTLGWQNGEFLLKFPEEILELEINNVTITNSKVTILGYNLEKKEDGYYLKILTENEEPEAYDIVVDCNITPDPRNLTVSKDIELYSINPICTSYKNEAQDKYDLDDDGNVQEYVGTDSYKVQLIGPTSLVTMETASEYNDKHDELETSIAPQVALIDKAQEDKTAKVSVSILNNYSGNISGIKLVGKIPFKGNKSQINEEELGSTFTTTMTGKIVIPEDIKEYAKVYYSENEVVTEDLEDSANNWIAEEEMTDYSKVKTYLIDLGDYVMQKGEEQICIYQLRVPEGLDYNEVSYSTHAVYFYLETSEGKLQDKTETNKLGFMIAKKYNLQIEKVKEGTEVKLKNAVYKLTEEGKGTTQLGVTNGEGILTFKDLFVERTYILQESKAPEGYQKSEEKVRLTTTVNELGELKLQILEGTVNATAKLDGQIRPIEVVQLEDEPKYNLEITKYEKDTNNPVEKAEYELSLEGADGKRSVITNANGIIELSGLSLNKIYKLQEVRAKGYYVEETAVKFQVVKNEENIEIKILQGNVKENNLIENRETSEIPRAEIVLEDEKVPTYNLQLKKYAKESDTLLEGATYRITGPGIEEGEDYKTDESGKLDITGLYEYVEGKNIDGIYTIKEIVPPQGYILNEQEIQIKVGRNAEGKLEIQVLNGSARIIKTETIEGETEEKEDITIDQENNLVIIGLEDEPLFKLIKKDGTTNEALPNTKFTIKEIIDETTETEAKDTKGNLVGELQTINGQEYRVVETNEKGEISVELQPGIYKIIEVEALEGYNLPDEIENRTYYFGIGKSIEEVRKIITNNLHEIIGNGAISTIDIMYNEDESYTVLGSINSRITFGPEETASGEEIQCNEQGLYNGIIIKYNNEDKVESAKEFERYNNYGDIKITSDGSIILRNDFSSKTITIPAEETVSGEAIELTNNGYYDGLIIKYNPEGKVEWAKSIGGTSNERLYSIIANKTGDIIVTGDFDSETLTIPAEETESGEQIELKKVGTKASDGFVIKYNKEGKVKWAKSIGGTSSEQLENVAVDEAGNIITVGQFWSATLTIPVEETVNGEPIKLTNNGNWDGLIIKYNPDGKVEWTRNIGGTYYDYLKGVETSTDGSIIVTGEFSGETLTIPAEETVNGEPIKLTNNGNWDGLIIKYNGEGKVEWAKSIGSTDSDNITNVVTNTDGSIIVSGYSYGKTLTIPAEETVSGEEIELTNNGDYEGIIIKYNAEGKVEWAQRTNKIITIKCKENTYIILDVNGEIIEIDEQSGSVVKEKQPKEDVEVIYDKLIKTEDGKILAIGKIVSYTGGKLIIPAEETANNEKIELTIPKEQSVLIITKYNKSGKVEWAKNIGGTSYDYLNNVEIDKDGNIIAVGFFYSKTITIPGEETVSGEEIELTNNGSNDGIIIKYNAEGKVEWAKNIGGTDYDYLENVVIDKDGNIITSGYFNSKTIIIPGEETVSGEEIELTNNGSNDGIIIKYNAEGKVEWAKNIGGTSYDYLDNVEIDKDGNIITVGQFWSATLTIPVEETVSGEEIELTNNGSNDGIIIKYNAEGKVEWAQSIGGTSYDSLHNVEIDKDGNIITSGYFNSKTIIIPVEETVSGEEIELTNNGSNDGIIIKYNAEGKVEWAKSIGGIDSDNLNAVIDKDENIIAIGNFYSETLTIPSENTASQSGDILLNKGINLIKYNKDGKVEFTIRLGESEFYDNVVSLGPTPDNGHIYNTLTNVDIPADCTVSGEAMQTTESGQYFVKLNSDLKAEKYYSVDDADLSSNIIEENGIYYMAGLLYGNSARLFTIEDKVILPEIADKTEIIVENNKKEYKITTEVKGQGGSISGQGSTIDNPYETVIHGEDSIKEIKAIPEEGYKVLKITVNGEEIEFKPEEDGSVILEKFINVTTNKYIIVEFSNTVSNVIVHHYLEGTTQSLKPDELKTGNIGENYTTAPRTDIEEYEIIKNSDYYGEEIPEGKEKDDYYIPENASGKYTEETQEVTYYYNKRPVKIIVNYYIEGTTEKLSETQEKEQHKNTEYNTNEATDIDERYELVEVPANSTGILTEDTVVNYYYKLKQHKVTTEVKPNIEINELGEEVEVKGGTISGENDQPYEEIIHKEDSQKEIIAVPEEGYYVQSIVINGEEISFTANANGSVTLNKFTEVTEDKHIEVKFAKKEGTVIVHHYIYDAETKQYTTIKLAEDEIKTGYVGTTYVTQKSDKVPQNYSCLNERPDKCQGEIVEGQIEVNYYYQLADTLMETKITKEAKANKTVEKDGEKVEVLTEEDGIVEYKIEYATAIKDYIGKAIITIVDKLPAKIDESKSYLAGGTYDSVNQTITWVYEANVDTYAGGNGGKGIDPGIYQSYKDGVYYNIIVREISISYLEQNVTENLLNKVTGTSTIYYPENHSSKPGKEKETLNSYDDVIVEQEYTIDKTVEKVWDDNENSKGKRPESVTIQLTANGQNVENELVILNESGNWKHTFTNLPKYTATGTEIKYSVKEQETNVGDLKYYESPVIEGTEKIVVTNKYKLMETNLNSKITKQGPEKITSKNQVVPYEVHYEATIEQYVGEAKLTIQDKLPYKIDVTKSELAGGIYDENTKTITWTSNIKDIDTYTNGNYEINITKNLKLVYEDMDVTQNSVVNYIKGTIDLYETEKSNTVDTTETTPIDIKGKVVVKYVDKETGKEILKDEQNTYGYTIEDKTGVNYTTQKVEIPNYKYVGSTDNTSGKIEEETIEVIYYYEKIPSGIVTVKYVDIDTKEEIIYKDESGRENTYGYEIEGYVGERYTTEEKEIPYYKLVKEIKPTNAEGTLEETEKTVTYYYRKLTFNISIDKNIKEITNNGESVSIRNGKLTKVEVHRNNTLTDKIIIKYSIIVSNTGEIAGSAKIEEQIPKHYKVTSGNPEYWITNANNNLETTVELEANESKELEVVLEWENGNTNFGEGKNTVTILSTENEANYEETITEDNTSTATIMMGIKTGREIQIIYIILILTTAIAIGMCYILKNKKET